MLSSEDIFDKETKFIIEKYEQIGASGNRQKAIKLSIHDIEKLK